MSSNTYKKIYVTFQKEGIHCYPAALNDPSLSDVSFLGYPHRHIFKFKVWIQVYQNDREIEFIQFQRWLMSLFNDDVLTLDYKSCEMISDELSVKIYEKYPYRDFDIEVSEDGENGCFIQYKKSERKNS